MLHININIFMLVTICMVSNTEQLATNGSLAFHYIIVLYMNFILWVPSILTNVVLHVSSVLTDTVICLTSPWREALNCYFVRSTWS